ncbi:MAG: phosphatase PAP2 family protein [Candidatus Roizmanbacteria bacterium]
MLNILKFDLYSTAFLRTILPYNSFFNYFFSLFSLKANSILIWILVIIVAVILEERKNPGISKRDKKFIVIFLAVFLTTGFLTTYVVKPIVRRPRPFFRTDYNRFQLIKPTLTDTCPKDFSFPSGHAATAFAIAAVLTSFKKKRKWFYYITAILISYSRIYLGCHYLFDVIAGAIFGYLISKIILLLLFSPYTFPFRRKN